MSRLLATSRRLALGLAAFALVAGLNASARADIGYAFAEETISNLTAAGTGGNGTVHVSLTNPASQASASLDGSGPANNGTTTAHAELGVPAAANNPLLAATFTKFATFSPDPALSGQLPTAPATSFTRGAVALVGTTGRAVAETYINSAGVSSGAGHGGNVLGFDAVVSATNTYDINFNYSNDAYAVVSNTGPGNTASGRFFFQIQIKDPTGAVIFTSTPTGTQGDTNGQAFAPPNGPEIVHTGGTATVVTPTLTAGLHYTVVFTLNADTDVRVNAVPEPATMAMALTAVPLVGLGLLRRRNRKAQA